MPWKVCDQVSQREEFVRFYLEGTISMTELCRRFEISRKTGYKWIARQEVGGPEALADQSRRPRVSPSQTLAAVEEQILELRDKHPCWGGRKLRRRLLDLNIDNVPAASTITEILRRHGKLIEPTRATRDFQRFEYNEPNDLWQMDFKGHFALRQGNRCHPLTVLDDHSRYSLGLRAMPQERSPLVKTELEELLRTYGLPRAILCDNGSPWGTATQGEVTRLSVWLIKQGIRVLHGRPYHPQTQGKEERFHRTLKAEVLQGREFANLPACQSAFDAWRPVYNQERPHEALDFAVPASRYQVSKRSYRSDPEPWDYGPGRLVRKVDMIGYISFQGQTIRISKALSGEHICLTATPEDGLYDVHFCQTYIRTIDLRTIND